MDHQTNVATAKRRTREEIRQIVAEFATSGMPQSEFCSSRGISRSSLDRHLRKRRAQDQGSRAGNRLLAVEIRAESGRPASTSSGLVVGLSGGRRIEVHQGFDGATLERLLTVLDKG
ncbi:MAG TPA: hypothetical protein VNO32_10050 [Candidatus Acidoferrum sp.]|nr:hypothetical protein [Candidatus Acidoferrum sp.]